MKGIDLVPANSNNHDWGFIKSFFLLILGLTEQGVSIGFEWDVGGGVATSFMY